MQEHNNQATFAQSAMPQALVKRFRDKIQIAQALVAVALLGVASLPEAVQAQTTLPGINVNPPSGGGGGWWGSGGGGGGVGGIGQGDSNYDPYSNSVDQNEDVASAVISTLTCSVIEEIRLADANASANNPITIQNARQGDLHVVTLADGNIEAWEYLCGGSFCAGTILNVSPKYSTCR